MSRRYAREDTFRIIFESLINKMEKDDYLADYFESVEKPAADDGAFLNGADDADKEYVERAVDGILAKQEELDGIISDNLRGWEVNRISKVSIAVLRLALFEIIYMDDVPMKVAINEAVELAKRYDGKECASFVNGALASAVKKLNIED